MSAANRSGRKVDLQSLALEPYVAAGIDPSHTPGIGPLVTALFGPESMGFLDTAPVGGSRLFQDDSGRWRVRLSPKSDNEGLAFGMALALARWTAMRRGAVLSPELMDDLAGCILVPSAEIVVSYEAGMSVSELARELVANVFLVARRVREVFGPILRAGDKRASVVQLFPVKAAVAVHQ